MYVPDLDGAVLGGGGHQVSIGTEDDSQNVFQVSGYFCPLVVVFNLPEPDPFVSAGRGQVRAVGAVVHREDRPEMPFEFFLQGIGTVSVSFFEIPYKYSPFSHVD